MAYVLEKIAPKDIETIFADADETKRSHLRMRGGHFVDGIDYVWAIDHEQGQYLLIAPTISAMSAYRYFYFYFHSVLYGFRIQGYSKPLVLFDDKPPIQLFEEFKRELTSAFEAHSFGGSPSNEPAFVPEFSSEGDRE